MKSKIQILRRIARKAAQSARNAECYANPDPRKHYRGVFNFELPLLVSVWRQLGKEGFHSLKTWGLCCDLARYEYDSHRWSNPCAARLTYVETATLQGEISIRGKNYYKG